MASSWAAALAPLVIAGLVSQLTPVLGIKCRTSVNGMVITDLNEPLKECAARLISCHEHYEVWSAKVTYHAGCGQYQSAFVVPLRLANLALASPKPLQEDAKECFTDGCNTGLLAELEKSNLICRWADRSASYAEVAIICPKSVKKCYVDDMTGAAQPLYFAGCGECPGYTLYCSNCVSNYCNGTRTAQKIVDVDEEQPSEVDEWLNIDEDDAGDCVRSAGASVALAAATALLALTLV